MLCLNPFRPRPGLEYGCGQCRACRVNRARMWTGRLLMEATCHVQSSFVTFTYAPEHLPETGLSNAHWRELTWLIGYRYFGVGEYGERYGRPHYHLILFGACPVATQEELEARWPYGHVHSLPFEAGSAAYVARYTTKKYLRDTPDFEGMTPEFQRMSRRPAIGAFAVERVFDWISGPAGAAFIARNGDVPSHIRVEGKVYPMGRTLHLKLRAAAGLPDALPELQERRRQERVLDLADPSFAAQREQLREAGFYRLRSKVSQRSGSL